MKQFTTSLKKATADDLYEISLKSSEAKEQEIYIFEKWEMSNLFDETRAEKIRQNFLKNNVKVKQITNIPILPKFTNNDEFINKIMTFRYVPKDLFLIENEILIFNDIVAIYNSEELLIIEDHKFANSQKQLFMSIWEQWQLPTLDFEYKPNHSLYNNIDYFIDDLQVIVWPDADARMSYKWFNEEQLGDYIKNIILSDDYYKDSSYIICLIWSLDWDKMIDIWKFVANSVDDRSWPLGDVRVYREGKLCTDLEVVSWNSLLILWYEEKLRRQSKDLKSYLSGPAPRLPLEIMNGKDFFSD